MRTNWLVILTILLTTLVMNVKDLIEFDRASIVIENVNVMHSYKGKILCYTINIYSPEQIKEVVVTPSVIGDNPENQTKFEFSNHTRKAKIIYYYAMPHDVKEQISIDFCLNSKFSAVNIIPSAVN